MEVNRDTQIKHEYDSGALEISLNDVNIDRNAVKFVSESLAHKYCLMPVEVTNNVIKVAMHNPLDMFALEDIKMVTGREVQPFKADADDIKKSIDKYYSNLHMQMAAEEISKEHKKNAHEMYINDETDSIKNAPAVKMVDIILKNAVKSRASDVHIEPFENNVRVRYRIDGELKEVSSFSREALNTVISRIKVLTNLNTAERRLPQDGKLVIQLDGKHIDFRISILPTVYGEKVVARVLSRENLIIGKKHLGLSSEELLKVERMAGRPYGLILVTGPTGSGKSTTLYSILKDFNTGGKNIVTIEDPVEYMMEYVSQVNVNINTGLTFAVGLRAILRQDPDVIMIGEIRDSETAEIAIRAAITGHIVLSTIHTNDAPSAIIRLIDMGIEPFLAATAISGVISQRLVRKICPSCKEEYYASEFEKKILGMDSSLNVKLFKGGTCQNCDYTGYIGRVGIFEIMEITKTHREYIGKNYSTDEIRELCARSGMKTLNDSCIELVLNGTTTMDELIKIAYIKE